jgi:hypothetical protein
MNVAELLVELKARGVMVEAAGGRLRVDAPKGAVTPDLREALAECKAEVLAMLTIDEGEIAWRVKAMLVQIPAAGPIPFLIARADFQSHDGCCLSCGEMLNTDDLYRCALCSRAANKALELAMMKI